MFQGEKMWEVRSVFSLYVETNGRIFISQTLIMYFLLENSIRNSHA